MKKWTIILVLIAIAAFANLTALTMTYYITIYDAVTPVPIPPVTISGYYHYMGNPYIYFSGTMTYYGPAARSLNGVAGRVYRYIDNSCNNGLYTYSANAAYRSGTSHIEGQCYWNTSPEFPYIYIPDPNTKPPEQ